MAYAIKTLLLLYAAGVLSLLWNLVRSIQLLRHQRTLPPAGRSHSQRPSLDVVVPVKDEEVHIAACLESVLAQDYPNLRIIVVNDRSTDGTAGRVRSIQDHNSNVERVDIRELPAGLYGKPHAIHSIASRLRGDYVAFVDSDLRLQPSCLATLVNHLESNGLDWVAVMGAPEIARFWERLIVPLFGAVIFAWYDPRKISDPNWPDALGSALMVCRRRAYEAIGGHGAVAGIYDEDSELMRMAKRAEQKVSFILTPELFTQRHYGSLARTVRGMTRTFVGAIKTIPRLLFTVASLQFVSHAPLVVAALLASAAVWGWPAPWAWLWWTAACTHMTVSTALAFLVYHTSGRDRPFALLHPLGAGILMFVCVRSLLHIWRGESIAWRGTQYRGASAGSSQLET